MYVYATIFPTRYGRGSFDMSQLIQLTAGFDTQFDYDDVSVCVCV